MDISQVAITNRNRTTSMPEVDVYIFGLMQE